MSAPYIGEIRPFAGNFAPVDWAMCNGQLISIAQNSTLFELIGTTYGGDGIQTYALPDLRGRRLIHQGTGPGLSPYQMGEVGGVENVTLTTQQIAGHSHTAQAVAESGTVSNPANNLWAQWSNNPYAAPGALVPMNPGAIGPAGGSQPHDNLSPFLVVTYIIALFGVFPSQN